MTAKTTKFPLTVSDVLAATGISRTRLHQLRSGFYAHKRDFEGVAYTLWIHPILIENEDWTWERGKTVYAAHTLEKLADRGIGSK